MMDEATYDRLTFLPLGGRSDRLVLLAGAAVLLAATQGAVQQLVAGGPRDVGAILEWRITPVLIWTVAAPFLLGTAREVRRVTRDSWPWALLAHGSLAAAWIVVSNLLMRVPGALRGEPLAALLADTLRGVVDYGPAAAAAYVGLVAIGLPRSSRRSAYGTDLLAVRNGVRIHMVGRSDIRWVQADGDHVRIHTPEQSYRTRGTLSAYERELEPDGFLRVHRSALVHPRAIREIQPYYRGDHVAILRDGSEIRIPRTRDDVLELLLAPIGQA